MRVSSVVVQPMPTPQHPQAATASGVGSQWKSLKHEVHAACCPWVIKKKKHISLVLISLKCQLDTAYLRREPPRGISQGRLACGCDCRGLSQLLID